mgnify:CR=1 FL=1
MGDKIIMYASRSFAVVQLLVIAVVKFFIEDAMNPVLCGVLKIFKKVL